MASHAQPARVRLSHEMQAAVREEVRHALRDEALREELREEARKVADKELEETRKKTRALLRQREDMDMDLDERIRKELGRNAKLNGAVKGFLNTMLTCGITQLDVAASTIRNGPPSAERWEQVSQMGVRLFSDKESLPLIIQAFTDGTLCKNDLICVIFMITYWLREDPSMVKPLVKMLETTRLTRDDTVTTYAMYLCKEYPCLCDILFNEFVLHPDAAQAQWSHEVLLTVAKMLPTLKNADDKCILAYTSANGGPRGKSILSFFCEHRESEAAICIMNEVPNEIFCMEDEHGECPRLLPFSEANMPYDAYRAIRMVAAMNSNNMDHFLVSNDKGETAAMVMAKQFNLLGSLIEMGNFLICVVDSNEDFAQWCLDAIRTKKKLLFVDVLEQAEKEANDHMVPAMERGDCAYTMYNECYSTAVMTQAIATFRDRALLDCPKRVYIRLKDMVLTLMQNCKDEEEEKELQVVLQGWKDQARKLGID